MLAALHTWGRTLTLHPHVHCLVSGGGLDPEGQWRAVPTGFLLPVAVVRSLFRGKVLGAVEQLWLTGQLQFPPGLRTTASGAYSLRRRGRNGISGLPSATRMAAA